MDLPAACPSSLLVRSRRRRKNQRFRNTPEISHRINRSSDHRAAISRGTGLSVALDSIPLLSQIVGSAIILNFVFPAKDTSHEPQLCVGARRSHSDATNWRTAG
jgi:hypothetical protein